MLWPGSQLPGIRWRARLVSSTLDARLCLLDYLHRSPSSRTVQDILHHLQGSTLWGQEQLASESKDSGLRSLQLWLKQLRDSREFSGFVEATPDPTNRRRLLYQVKGGPAFRMAMPIEEALLVALAEQHLALVIPSEFRVASLEAVFASARATIERVEANQPNGRPAVGHYLRSVTVHPRGQPLVSPAVPGEAFSILSSALLHRRCIRASYNGRMRHLHPCALVVRSPKLYLVAREDRRTAPDKTSTARAKTYACHLLDDITPLPDHAYTAGFELQEFLRDEGLEVPLNTPEIDPPARTISLMLHIHPTGNQQHDALLEDLALHPLDPHQRLTSASDHSHHVLSVKRIVATEALANWILGRLDRVEVVSPVWLRQLIVERIAAVHQRYLG